MSSFIQTTLCEVADVKLSNVDKKSKPEEREIRLCNYTDVYKNAFISKNLSKDFMLATCNDNEYVKFILREGQVAVTKDSEKPNDIGIPTYISESFEDVVLGYHLALFTPVNEKIDGRYLYYWLNTSQAKRYFENNAGGSGQRCSLPLDILKAIPLSLPSFTYQKSVSDFLFNLDTKIELNNRINAELEAMAKTLYDYWFVQFDFPNEQGKPYKSSGGKMVYNKELKREIPEGWEVKALNEIAEIKAGGDKPKVFSSTKTDLCQVPIYSNGIANEGFYGYTDSAKIINQSITITGRGANVGFCVLRNVPFVPIIRLLVVTPHFPYYSKFLFERLKDINFNNSGSAQPQITVPQISSLKVLMPKEEILKKYDALTSAGIKKIEACKEENQQLASLRDWLLPMLMNGQVTVKEAEEKLGDLGMVAEPEENYKN